MEGGEISVSEFDLVIKNARLREDPAKLFTIGIRDGRIARISSEKSSGDRELDANGCLVTEAFVNPHLHMCKVYTLKMIGEEAIKLYQTPEMGTAMTAIEVASEVKRKYDASWIYENAKRALMLALKHGVLHIRAFVDTDTKAKLEGIKALLRLRDDFKDFVKIQVVAFPQDGVVRDPGAEEMVRKAVEMGADVVGGIPWIEFTDEDAKKHVDLMFDIAKEYNRDVAMLTDDAGDAGLRTTEMLVRRAIKEGWKGRVEICHARAMQLYPDPYFQKLVSLLRQADAGVVSDPHTGPLHARVRELLNAGVTVALGQDDIADAYYPYGRNCMLEVAFLASHLLWMTTFSDMETLYNMITRNPAKILRVDGYGLRAGCRADFVVLGVESVWAAIAT
ncbi:MAG: amidohydrolase family protein [Candidatus Hadarchaeales archaeon]